MIGALIGAGVSLIGASRQASAARSAQRSQERVGREQIALARETRDMARADQQPFVSVGVNALGAASSDMGLGPRPDGYAGYTASPGYQFAVDEALDAIQGSAANSGGLFSGATGRAVGQTVYGLASQDFGNHLNRLLGVAGMGQAAASGQATSAFNGAGMTQNALANIGNAQAAGAVARGNAWSGALDNIGGIFGYQNALNMGNPGMSSMWGTK